MIGIQKRYEEGFPNNRMACGFSVAITDEVYNEGFTFDMSACFADITFARLEFYAPSEDDHYAPGDITTANLHYGGSSSLLLKIFLNEIEITGNYSGSWCFRVEGEKR